MKLKPLLTLTLTICASATVLKLQPSARIFDGEDLLGKYELFVKQGKCPQTVQHLNYTEVPLVVEGTTYSAYAVQHSDIIQQGVKCESVGQFAIVPNSVIDAAGYREALGEAAPVVDDLHEQNAEFLVGVELVKRECGDTYLSRSALAIFIEQEKKVRVPGLISLYPGAKYIVIYEKDSPTPCTYFQPIPGRTIGQGAGNAVDEQLTEEDFVIEDTATTSSDPRTENASGGEASSVPPLDGMPLPGQDGQATGEESSTAEEDILPEESPSSGSSTCFPADAMVTVETGAQKRMDEVEIGDRVLVGDGSYSEVFMFTHRDESVTSEFIEIIEESGSRLQLTQSHYLYAGNSLKAAGSVKIGDSLRLSDGSRSNVKRLRKVINTGLYNPQTCQGDIVVNGIIASTYTTTVHPSSAHSLLAPLRAAYQSMRIAIHWLDYGSDTISEILPKGTDIV